MTTYEEVKRVVLELINQYSIAGETISPAYNNQSDYIHRIPNLFNAGVMELRTAGRPRRAVYMLPSGEGEPVGTGTGWYSWTMPRECRRILSGGVKVMDSSGAVPVTQYQILGGNTLALPAGQDGFSGKQFLVEYERFPEQIPVDPADEYEIDEDPDIIQAACFYAAAGLVLMEDEFVYAALRNEYEGRLQRMSTNITMEYVDMDSGGYPYSGCGCYGFA